LPRFGGQARAGMRLKTAGFRQNQPYQNKAIGTKKTTAMMMKTYIVTLSVFGNVT
jgi:hypothetical protein